ncbi:caspase family protein [Streptomyces albidoflavus]
MGETYALLVGIDAYPEPLRSLRGCLADVAAVGAMVRARTGGAAHLTELADEKATVDAVAGGLRLLAERAGPGDTVFFWYSGHGTTFDAEGPALLTEPSGRSQALACHDGPLLDRQLGTLLDAVAATGAHVAACLDCCHSAGATREGTATVRWTPPAPHWRVRTPGPGVRDAAPLPEGRRRHVLLAACQNHQTAKEIALGTGHRGAFSVSLLDAVAAAPAWSTYRELLAAAGARVERTVHDQHPALYPAEPDGPADTAFLGEAPRRDATAPFLLRRAEAGWEVDCGAGHGLPQGSGAAVAGTEFTTLPRPGAAPLPGLRLTARAVQPARTLVEPAGWVPDPATVHPVALSALALPAATLSLEGTGPGREALEQAVLRSGPGGGPTPLLRLTPETAPPAGPGPHVRAVLDGTGVRLLRRDGSPFLGAPLPLTGPREAAAVVAGLVGMARWHGIRDLAAPPSPYDAAVRLEIALWDEPDRLLRPDRTGTLVVPYTWGPEGPRPPVLSVRLRHTGAVHAPLWCALLDLNDRYGCSPALFPGDHVHPGRTGHALGGQAVVFSLPPGRTPRSGASATDWLTLLVAPRELNTAPFHLTPWEPGGRATRDLPGPPAGAADDGVLRLDPAHRDLGGAALGGWSSRTLRLHTYVP